MVRVSRADPARHPVHHPAVDTVVLVMPRVPGMAKSGPASGHMTCILGALQGNGSISRPSSVNYTSGAHMVKQGCGHGISREFSENQSTLWLMSGTPVGVCARVP